MTVPVLDTLDTRQLKIALPAFDTREDSTGSIASTSCTAKLHAQNSLSMCVVCWQEFDDCVNPAVDLGCGHYGCKACREAIHNCPVCNMAVASTPNSKWCDSRQVTAYKIWSTPRRRFRCDDDKLEDIVDDDHLTATLLGSADEATAPRVRMLERAPSSAGGSVPSRSHSSAAAVSARHLARGGFLAGRTVVSCALVPAARLSFFVSKVLLTTTCRTAAGAGRVLSRATCRFVKFASAPRQSIIGYDGTPQPPALPPYLSDQDPTEADSAQVSRVGGSGGGSRPHRPSGRGSAPVKGSCPEPVSNIVGGRIRLRDCRNMRLRIEYCRDCVVVASDLEAVELLMVGCQRVKLVMRNCSGLVLRELQCSNMSDFVRRKCPNFVHEIVCLRCACKPLCSSGGLGGYC